MTPRQFYSFIYVLMCKEAGSRQDLEEQLEQWAMEDDMVRARYTREVPESVAKQQLELMSALGGPAPLKERKES